MGFKYHSDYIESYTRILKKLEAQRGSPAHSAAWQIKEHFLPNGLEASEAPLAQVRNLYFSLTFLTSDTFDQAVKKVDNNRYIRLRSVEDHMIKSINDGPREWLESSESEFIAKGLIRGRLYYHIAQEEHLPGTAFDALRARVVPEHRILMDGAIDSAYGRSAEYGKTVIRPEVLNYMLLQFQPEGPARDALLAEKRDQLSYGRHDVFLAKSVEMAETIAAVIGHNLGNHKMILPEESTNRRNLMRKLANKPATAAFTSASRQALVEKDVQDASEAAGASIIPPHVEQAIRTLFGNGTLRGAQAAHARYMFTPRRDGTLRTDMEVVSRFTTTTGHLGLASVRETRAAVNAALPPELRSSDLRPRRAFGTPEPA